MGYSQLRLSTELKNEFISFLANHPPAEFSSRLRSVFFEYLRYETKTGVSPLFLHDFLWSLNDLFDLLDTAAKEFGCPSGQPVNQSLRLNFKH